MEELGACHGRERKRVRHRKRGAYRDAIQLVLTRDERKS